jgi:4-amino-4-deoxy-L-arabinose transferase-like glycosyltransferase
MAMTQREARTAPGKLGVTVCTLLWAGLLLVGFSAAAASFIPYGVFLARAKAATATGQLSFFTHDFYQAMLLRLRVIGAANLTLGLIVFLFRTRVYKFIGRIFSDSLVLVKGIKVTLKSVSTIDALSVISLLSIAAFLRIPLLFQPMRYDEAYTFLQYSSRPFYSALSLYNAPNNHLFHTLLVRLAYLVFGNHPWAIRLPALLAGLCMVPATYVAARSLYRGKGALLAAALVASSSILIEYSTNARGYIIVSLLFMLLIPVATYAIRNQNWAAWVLLAIMAALGFYTIPIMLYPFGAICLWLVLSIATGDARPSPRGAMAGLLAAGGLAAFFTLEMYAPVFAVSGPGAVFANKWIAASPLHDFLLGMPPSLASTWSEWNRDLPSWVTWLLVAGFGISLLWHPQHRLFRVSLPFVVVLWIAVLVLAQRVIPFERVWLFALPLFFIAATAGLAAVLTPPFERLRVRPATALVAIAIAILIGLRVQHRQSIYSNNHGRGLEALALYLKAHLGPGDSVVAALPSDNPLLYYFQQLGVSSSYLNAPQPKRMLVVVNGVAGDTVPKVLQLLKLTDQQTGPAHLLVQYDSASLYELTTP